MVHRETPLLGKEEADPWFQKGSEESRLGFAVVIRYSLRSREIRDILWFTQYEKEAVSLAQDLKGSINDFAHSFYKRYQEYLEDGGERGEDESRLEAEVFSETFREFMEWLKPLVTGKEMLSVYEFVLKEATWISPDQVCVMDFGRGRYECACQRLGIREYPHPDF